MEPTPTLKDRWKRFGSQVFDPWNLVLIIGTSLLIYAASVETNKAFTAVLSLMASVATGTLYGFSPSVPSAHIGQWHRL